LLAEFLIITQISEAAKESKMVVSIGLNERDVQLL
jgi:hypothetical protein